MKASLFHALQQWFASPSAEDLGTRSYDRRFGNREANRDTFRSRFATPSFGHRRAPAPCSCG